MTDSDTTLDPRYPDIEVQLTGQDGNAYAILGTVQKALRTHLNAEGMDAEAIDSEVAEYHRQATEGNYDHLLQVTMRWVTVA